LGRYVIAGEMVDEPEVGKVEGVARFRLETGLRQFNEVAKRDFARKLNSSNAKPGEGLRN